MLQRYRKVIMLLVDLILINTSLFLAFMIRYDWQLTPKIFDLLAFFMVWAVVIRLSIFKLLGLYQWSFRFASLSEAISVTRAVLAGSLGLIAVAFYSHSNGLGRSVLLIDFFICLFLIGTSRFFYRIFVKFQRFHNLDRPRVLIIGAGAAGAMVARELVVFQKKDYLPVGFIDDFPTKRHTRIHGIRVLGTTEDIKKIVTDKNIQELIIAIPSAPGRVIRRIISQCENLDVKIKIIPSLNQILSGEKTVREIRDVNPQDLLGREKVQINSQEVGDFIRDKVIMVTGAGGTIGSELCRQIIKFNPRRLIAYDHNENDTYFLELELKKKYPYIPFQVVVGDIKDIGLLKHSFTRFKPQIVFHSAAHKHVPLMEENPVAAVKNNIIGTRNFMYAAEHYGVERFVMISSDKAVNPTSVMGASKRIAEMIIQAKAKMARTKFMAVRFGNVIGSSGSVVPIFKKQIEEGGPVTVTHPEVKRYFMLASEAAQLVIEAAAIGKGGEIFILDMGDQIKIIDLAKNLITLSGLEIDEDIEIKFIGLRPGEKLMEELLLDIEHDQATKYEKIFIAQPKDFDLLELRRDVKELERMATLMDEGAIINKMQAMVSNFKRKEFFAQPSIFAESGKT